MRKTLMVSVLPQTRLSRANDGLGTIDGVKLGEDGGDLVPYPPNGYG